MFEAVDQEGTGRITYAEFYDAFKGLAYGLTENDVKTLVALADEDEEGMIAWESFIPIGIDSIKTFFSRNKML